MRYETPQPIPADALVAVAPELLVDTRTGETFARVARLTGAQRTRAELLLQDCALWLARCGGAEDYDRAEHMLLAAVGHRLAAPVGER